jgi:hypothetical protein
MGAGHHNLVKSNEKTEEGMHFSILLGKRGLKTSGERLYLDWQYDKGNAMHIKVLLNGKYRIIVKPAIHE